VIIYYKRKKLVDYYMSIIAYYNKALWLKLTLYVLYYVGVGIHYTYEIHISQIGTYDLTIPTLIVQNRVVQI